MSKTGLPQNKATEVDKMTLKWSWACKVAEVSKGVWENVHLHIPSCNSELFTEALIW